MSEQRRTREDAQCAWCEGELDSMKWEILDSHGNSYGYACDNCAHGAFDSYMESKLG